MPKLFQRLVGVGIVAIVLLTAAVMVWIILLNDPESAWHPAQFAFAGLGVFAYNTDLPAGVLIVAALVFAALMVCIVVTVERLVTRRYRRTPVGVESRPLSPRNVMARTRGTFAGEVTITVMIPAHNEEASLGHTLMSLSEQTRHAERIIVVADNCTDGTAAVARSFGAEVFETVGNTHKKGGALNQALAQHLPNLGDNDAVLVMDADTQLSPDFLRVAVQRFTADRALMAVGGLFLGESGHGMLGQFQRNEYFRYQREIRRREGRVFVLTGTGTAFRASALATVASSRGTLIPGRAGEVYDTFALTEDNELTIALKSLGGLITSPNECVVTTELMPSWRMLWAQRLRWQRGALENLGTYGVTPQTFRYWAQQVAIGYGVLALFAYFALIIIMLVAMDTFIWFPFWIGIGVIFALERVVTAWRGGWKARLLAATVFPELIYDCFLNLAFLKGIVEISLGRSATWKHVEHRVAANTEELSDS